MKQESRVSHEARIQAAKLREFARMHLGDDHSDMLDAVALARLLAEAEDDIAEGRTRPFRLFFTEFHKKL